MQFLVLFNGINTETSIDDDQEGEQLKLKIRNQLFTGKIN